MTIDQWCNVGENQET